MAKDWMEGLPPYSPEEAEKLIDEEPIFTMVPENNLERRKELRQEIKEGVTAGADLFDLFLKALEYISLTVDGNDFQNEIRDTALQVYGKRRTAMPLDWLEAEAEKDLSAVRKLKKRTEQSYSSSLEMLEKAEKEAQARVAAVKNEIVLTSQLILGRDMQPLYPPADE